MGSSNWAIPGLIASLSTYARVNEIGFLNLKQEQQLHDVATRLSVLRDEVLKN